MGSSHRQNQLPCQDAFCYRHLGDRLVAVVCDGAGSAAYSEQGGGLVAHALADRLATFITAPDENQLAIPGAFSDEDLPCSCCMKGELPTADL